MKNPHTLQHSYYHEDTSGQWSSNGQFFQKKWPIGRGRLDPKAIFLYKRQSGAAMSHQGRCHDRYTSVWQRWPFGAPRE